MSPGYIVESARDRAHDATISSWILRFKVIRNSPDAEERHLRLNWPLQGPEMKEDRTGWRVANRVRLENVFAIGAAQSLDRQVPQRGVRYDGQSCNLRQLRDGRKQHVVQLLRVLIVTLGGTDLTKVPGRCLLDLLFPGRKRNDVRPLAVDDQTK